MLTLIIMLSFNRSCINPFPSYVAEHGTVTLAIPCQVSGLCLLEALLDCPLPLLEAESKVNCSGAVSAPVRVVGGVRDVIIRPTAGRYKPGDEREFERFLNYYTLRSKALFL